MEGGAGGGAPPWEHFPHVAAYCGSHWKRGKGTRQQQQGAAAAARRRSRAAKPRRWGLPPPPCHSAPPRMRALCAPAHHLPAHHPARKAVRQAACPPAKPPRAQSRPHLHRLGISDAGADVDGDLDDLVGVFLRQVLDAGAALAAERAVPVPGSTMCVVLYWQYHGRVAQLRRRAHPPRCLPPHATQHYMRTTPPAPYPTVHTTTHPKQKRLRPAPAPTCSRS